MFFTTVLTFQTSARSSAFESVEELSGSYLVFTPGAREKQFECVKKIKNITAVNLDMAYSLLEPEHLFNTVIPTLRYLKVKSYLSKILPVLPQKAPNIEMLDLSGAIISTSELDYIYFLKNLRILDISNARISKEDFEALLSKNRDLTVYAFSLRRTRDNRINVKDYSEVPNFKMKKFEPTFTPKNYELFLF